MSEMARGESLEEKCYVHACGVLDYDGLDPLAVDDPVSNLRPYDDDALYYDGPGVRDGYGSQKNGDLDVLSYWDEDECWYAVDLNAGPYADCLGH